MEHTATTHNHHTQPPHTSTMVFFIPPKTVNKYVKKYNTDVMKVVHAFRTKHKLVPTGPEVAEYRQEQASKFWYGAREENTEKSEEFIRALQS
jgi:hypothetical protein